METHMNDKVHIQLQDHDGNWRTQHTTFNNSQRILQEMKTVKSRHPDKRVRAIDKDGRMVDMLG